MSAEYSVGELRTEASKQLEYGSKTAWEMLTAYADLRERIKADDGAVPVAWQQKRRPKDYPDEWRECSKETFDFINQRKESPWIVRELFDNPPAQAAQVDKPPRLGGCCCGEPCTLGVVHRTDGPCFVYTQPADSGRVGDNAPIVQQLRGRAAFLRDKGRIKSPEIMERAADALEVALAAQGQGEKMPVPVSLDRTHKNKAYLTLGFCDEQACSTFFNAISRGRDLYTHTAPPASPAGVPDGEA